MTIAVVVVCPADVHADAVEWGGAGLIADSFWVSSDEAVLIDPDRPNDVRVTRISPEQVHDPAPLAESLARLGSLDEVRVAWVRPPEDQLSASLKSLEKLLRELLPSDVNRWFDIVVPTRRTDRTVIPLPGQWVQLRICAEDRSAPDVTDAGWDLDLDVPLHTALVSTGILGGTFAGTPWAGESAANHYEIRAFSRLVLGAGDTGPAADRFITQIIPDSSAARFFPDKYLELEGGKAAGLVEKAVQHMQRACSGTLAYNTPPTSQFAPPPKLSLGQHLQIIFRFLGYCLTRLLGLKEGRHSAGRSRFQFDDLGHTIETKPRETELVSLQPADFEALDAASAERNRTEIDQLRRELNRKPPDLPPGVWRTLIALTAVLNDGGTNPEGWEPAEDHERRPVLHPRWVQPTAPRPVITEVPELARARNSAVAALATADAQRAREPALAVLPDTSGAVKSAQDLAIQGNNVDQLLLSQQCEELDGHAEHQPVSFLDRLSGRVLGAAIRARFDADRWSDFAVDRNSVDATDWASTVRLFRRRMMIGIGAGAAAAGIWALVAHFLRGSLPVWLTMPIGFGVLGAVAGAFLLWTLYGFFKKYTAYTERGRRRLELRRLWLARACAALREEARLAEVLLVFHKWVDILDAIFPRVDRQQAAPARRMPENAPKCMAVAVPTYSEKELIGWFAEDMQAGWRRAAFDGMSEEAVGVEPSDALKRLVEDHGLTGGALHDMWEHRHALWDHYAESLRFASTADIAAQMVESDERGVSLITKPAGPRAEMSLGDFRTQPWPDSDDDVRRWGDGAAVRYSRSRLQREHDVQLNADACLISVRVQWRGVFDDTEQPVEPSIVDTSAAEQKAAADRRIY